MAVPDASESVSQHRLPRGGLSPLLVPHNHDGLLYKVAFEFHVSSPNQCPSLTSAAERGGRGRESGGGGGDKGGRERASERSESGEGGRECVGGRSESGEGRREGVWG